MRPTPALSWFEKSMRSLCRSQPQPVQRRINGETCYRFAEQTIRAAILLKTIRYVSGLNAGRRLLSLGFVQELGALQRSIQDFAEDATFLSLGCVLDDITDLHRQYLTAFWEEEPSFEEYLKSQKNRNEVPRRKIQSYIATKTNEGTADHGAIATSKYISRIYSGFIHGAAPHLMDMYDPQKETFEVNGTSNSHLVETHCDDFEHYLFRGVVLLAIVAQALGERSLHEEALSLQQELKPHFT